MGYVTYFKLTVSPPASVPAVRDYVVQHLFSEDLCDGCEDRARSEWKRLHPKGGLMSGRDLVELLDGSPCQQCVAIASGYLDELLSTWGWPAKWYSYEDDMLKLSQAFPEVSFVLTGDGEERDDVWTRQYSQGRCVKVPEWSEFLESQLPPQQLADLKRQYREQWGRSASD